MLKWWEFPSGSDGLKKKKNLPEMKETWVQSLDWEDPLKKGWQPTAVLLPGELQSMGSQLDKTGWLNGQADMLKWYLKKVL